MSVLVLAAASIAAGAGMLLAMRRFSNQAAIRAAKARVRAHLYEIRLFGDDPSLMLRAQRNLLLWNARYIALMLRPLAVVIVPMLLLMWQLDRAYGTRPLYPGESTLVVARTNDTAPELKAPAGFAIETPAVRVPGRGEAYWRVRAIRSVPDRPQFQGTGKLSVEYPSASVCLAGLHAHWLVWFLLFSAVTMFALRRAFRVTF